MLRALRGTFETVRVARLLLRWVLRLVALWVFLSRQTKPHYAIARGNNPLNMPVRTLEPLCCVCLEPFDELRPPKTLYWPCTHEVCCLRCTLSLDTRSPRLFPCPICREPVHVVWMLTQSPPCGSPCRPGISHEEQE